LAAFARFRRNPRDLVPAYVYFVVGRNKQTLSAAGTSIALVAFEQFRRNPRDLGPAYVYFIVGRNTQTLSAAGTSVDLPRLRSSGEIRATSFRPTFRGGQTCISSKLEENVVVVSTWVVCLKVCNSRQNFPPK
jgi:hypothetical protein